MNQIRYFLTGTLCLLAMTASAQWQWTDQQGHRVFSDRAPPADITEKNILQRPTSAGAPSAPASAPQGGASALKLSGIDKELAEKKKKAEDAEVAKRKTEEERVLKARVENCARAKQARTNFNSGMRIAHINEKGEREVLDDAARATEIRRIQSVIDSDCR